MTHPSTARVAIALNKRLFLMSQAVVDSNL